MKNIARKLVSFLLLIGILTIALTSCGGNGDNFVSGFSGEIGSDAMTRFGIEEWKGDGNKSDAVNYSMRSVDDATYEEFISGLARGTRLIMWSFAIKDVESLESKILKKIAFTMEADRAVKVTIETAQNGFFAEKTVSLSANVPLFIEVPMAGEGTAAGAVLRVLFLQLAESEKLATGGRYLYNTEEMSEWSQTIYKVTNFKLFCE